MSVLTGGACKRDFRRLASCRAAVLVVLWAATIASTGCGKAKPSGPQGTVHGTVKLNGAPVGAGSMITFLGESGAAASALVGADGGYRLSTTQGEQVPVGAYKVIVLPPKTVSEATPEQAMEASTKAQDGGAAPASPLPAKYRNPTTTPETRDVKEGDNEINLELTD